MQEDIKDQLLKIISIPKRTGEKKKQIQKFVLCCMDFRYPDVVTQFMERKGCKQDYDIFVLAGASIGVMYPDDQMKQHWRQSFIDHLKLAKKLHKFKEVIVIHHFDCGACKMALGRNTDVELDREQQFQYHKERIQQTRDLVTVQIQDISFQAYIIEEVKNKKAQFQFYSNTQKTIEFKPLQITLNTNIQYKSADYAQQDIETIIADLKKQRDQLKNK